AEPRWLLARWVIAPPAAFPSHPGGHHALEARVHHRYLPARAGPVPSRRALAVRVLAHDLEDRGLGYRRRHRRELAGRNGRLLQVGGVVQRGARALADCGALAA